MHDPRAPSASDTPAEPWAALRCGAMARVPWHRAVNGRGELSTEPERPGLQRELLEREGARLDAEGRLDLAQLAWKPCVATPAAKKTRITPTVEETVARRAR